MKLKLIQYAHLFITIAWPVALKRVLYFHEILSRSGSHRTGYHSQASGLRDCAKLSSGDAPMYRAFSVSGISFSGKHSNSGVPAGYAATGNGDSLISFLFIHK